MPDRLVLLCFRFVISVALLGLSYGLFGAKVFAKGDGNSPSTCDYPYSWEEEELLHEYYRVKDTGRVVTPIFGPAEFKLAPGGETGPVYVFERTFFVKVSSDRGQCVPSSGIVSIEHLDKDLRVVGSCPFEIIWAWRLCRGKVQYRGVYNFKNQSQQDVVVSIPGEKNIGY